MRSTLFLAIILSFVSGCCSAHRRWTDGYGSCVSPCEDGGCQSYCESCGSAHRKSCLFGKRSGRTRYTSSGVICGAECGSCGGCSSCGNGMIYDGMMSGGCSSCSSMQSVYDGSGTMTSSCPSCQQQYSSESSLQLPADSPSSTPTPSTVPPTPPASTPNPMQGEPPIPSPAPAPEPTTARMLMPMNSPGSYIAKPLSTQTPAQPMQPLFVVPAQALPVQYQEVSSPLPLPQPQSQSLVPYNPPAIETTPIPATPPTSASLPISSSQTAVQPVLWVPAQSPQPRSMPSQTTR